jgi:TetR/AcrR family transcriptional regulator
VKEQRRPNKRVAQSQETRQRLLHASLQLFVDRGYAGTTVRQIAVEAAVSPGLMFHYFPSKQALLEEHVKTLNVGVERVAQLLSDAEVRPLDAFDRVTKLFLGSFNKTTTKRLMLLANQVATSNSMPVSAKRLLDNTRSFDASVAVIIRGQQTGEIKSGEPRSLALVFWGALQGTAQLMASLPGLVAPHAEDIVGTLKPTKDR